MSGVLGPASYLTPEFKLYAPYDTGVSPIPGPTGGVAVVSPLVIKSKDGLSETSISVSNGGGITTITPPGGNVSELILNSQSTITKELFVSDKLTVQPPGPTGAGNITIGNGSNAANYGIFVASETGEGLVENDLMIYGYPSTGGDFLIMDANVQGTAIQLGSFLAPDGCNVQINGTQGVSRVFDGLYNPPPAGPFQIGIDPAAPFALLVDGTSSITVKGAIKYFTLDAVPPLSPGQEIPSI